MLSARNSEWENGLVSEPSARDNSKLREIPKVSTTTFSRKLVKGTRLIAEHNGKNVENDPSELQIDALKMKWIIRIQAPKSAMIKIWRRFRDYNGLGLRSLIKLLRCLKV